MIAGLCPLRFLGLSGLLTLLLGTTGAGAAELAAGASQFHKDIQPILTEYCYDCHGDGMKKGGVAFDEFKSDEAVLTNRDLWMNALKYLRAGIMPPDKKPRPTDAQKQAVANWIKTDVFGIDPKNLDPGRVTVRRLNRVEYRNTIRDLMGVDYDTSVEFPPDDTGYGFDDIGDVLTLSPMLMEKYIAAADNIVSRAVPVISRVVPEISIAGGRFHDGTERESRRSRETPLFLPYYKPAAVAANFEAPHEGSYEVSLEMTVKGDFDFDPAKCQAVFKLDGQPLLDKEFGWNANKTFPFEFDQALSKGNHRLEFELRPLNGGTEGTNTLVMRLVNVTVRGPMEKQFAITPKNYTRFFPREVPTNAKERREYARDILRNFATKAFRRPVDEPTVNRLATLASGVYSQPGKSFESGIAYALEAVIASPRFLFRIEENVPADRHSTWSDVDEYSLASRLSYFLWSTMPDDELTRLAGRGELRKNLGAQVQRMLADSRAEELVDNFTGQWLQVRDVEGITINARAVLARDQGSEREQERQIAAFRERQAAAAKEAANGGVNAQNATNSVGRRNGQRRNGQAPAFFRPRFELDGDLRSAMKNETEMFFASIVKEDRPVTDLIDCNYTFLNEKLARLYGLTNLNITGPEMRRVTLPADCQRGGILAEGTVLTVTSNPDRTSPVKRGLFVLSNILGTPAPPPPPNIPALEASESGFTKQPTLRETLELHRKEPLCASCHNRMDPIGLAMENFNALGMWREQERGQSIEPAGKLITGESFNDLRELKHILVTNHRSDFYRCLTEKLMTYAVGRGLEYYDVETVDKIVRDLEQNNGRFSVLLNGIIESAPFQRQRSQANTVFADSSEPTEKTSDRAFADNRSKP
jgi:mono/diheme cytochrome c family protein